MAESIAHATRQPARGASARARRAATEPAGLFERASESRRRAGRRASLAIAEQALSVPPAWRIALALWPAALSLGVLVLVGLGRVTAATPVFWALTAALAGALVARGWQRFHERHHARQGRRARFELDLTLCAFALAELAVSASGGASSDLSALLYPVAAAVGLWHGLPRGAALVAGFALVDALLLLVPGAPVSALARSASLACLGLVAAFAEPIVAARLRMRRRPGELERALARADRRTPDQEHAALALAATHAHSGVQHMLELAHCALRPHLVALFWMDEDTRTLRLREAVGTKDALSQRPIRFGEGLLGGLAKHGAPIVLSSMRDPSRLGYYDRTPSVRGFLGVPVTVDGEVRGVLIADRTVDSGGERDFDETDELLLALAARELARALGQERLFTRLGEAKAVQERFYRASESLREAVSFEDVYRATTTAAREISQWDFAAATRLDAETGAHAVAFVHGDADARLLEQRIDDSSLCAMAVKNRHELPAFGEAPSEGVALFGPRGRLSGYESLLVLPLIARGVAHGTLVLAAKRRGAFPQETREMLRVIANQAASTLEHAAAYARLETLATTDGLTGLLNHRQFEERTGELLARAERMQRTACLILCDVDHFKRINDTYGHPVGDMVLREIGKLLADSGRKIDIVARYGGEEFALVLEDTDLDGGVMLAERIRGELATRTFRAEQGRGEQAAFRVTMSFGVAAYPKSAKEQAPLIAAADQALYAAKHGGRNKVVPATRG